MGQMLLGPRIESCVHTRNMSFKRVALSAVSNLASCSPSQMPL